MGLPSTRRPGRTIPICFFPFHRALPKRPADRQTTTVHRPIADKNGENLHRRHQGSGHYPGTVQSTRKAAGKHRSRGMPSHRAGTRTARSSVSLRKRRKTGPAARPAPAPTPEPKAPFGVALRRRPGSAVESQAHFLRQKLRDEAPATHGAAERSSNPCAYSRGGRPRSARIKSATRTTGTPPCHKSRILAKSRLLAAKQNVERRLRARAERGGFEPPIAVYPRCRFSKPVHSTTLPSLRMVLEGSLAIAARSFNRMFALLRTSRPLTHNSRSSIREGACGRWMKRFEFGGIDCWRRPRGTSRWGCTNMPWHRWIRSTEPARRGLKPITGAAT